MPQTQALVKWYPSVGWVELARKSPTGDEAGLVVAFNEVAPYSRIDVWKRA